MIVKVKAFKLQIWDSINNLINPRFRPADPEDLLKAFKLLDIENRGYIMRKDLEKALMEVGEPFSKEEINEMMAIACDPETSRINYEHYINLLIVSLSSLCTYARFCTF